MSAENDIVERLEALARFYDNQSAHSLNRGPNCYAIRAELARDSAAEIVRLRGEVGTIPQWIYGWMADRGIVPADDGDGIDASELLEALNQYERDILAEPAPARPNGVEADSEVPCSDHPDAPHGFDRNGSHNAGRYVCDCEGWQPEALRAADNRDAAGAIAPAEAKGGCQHLRTTASADGQYEFCDICKADLKAPPQPAGGEAVAPFGYEHGGQFWPESEAGPWVKHHATKLYTHPPAAQVQHSDLLLQARAVLNRFRSQDDDAITVCNRIDKALATHPAACELGAVRELPWDDDVRNILGRPNFSFIGNAQVMRAAGRDVPRKAEEEQAYCLHWLLNLYLKHGAGWMDAANAELEAMRPAALQHRGDSQEVGRG